MKRILAINPGSTSTKIGIFEDDKLVLEKKVEHSADELKDFARVADQFEYRKEVLLSVLAQENLKPESFDAIVGRGGLMKPIVSGTYHVSDAMLEDFREAKYGEHASNLGAMIATALAEEGTPAYIVDPVVVDELDPIARISGLKGIERVSIFHALNQKAVAKRYAAETGSPYDQLNLIVAHLGGGVSVAAHKKGRCVDVNNALDGEGPFSPERTGGLPVRDVIRLSYSGEYSDKDLRKQFVGKGGLVSYFGTQDAREVQKMGAEGNEEAKLVYDAMGYQVAKEIAANAAVLHGEVDAILLTGGIAYDKEFVGKIEKAVSWIAKVVVYPGEDELEALAQGALRCLTGKEEARIYD